GCGDQLREDGHGERGALAGDVEARLDELLEGVDVVLEIAGEEFAHFLIETIDVGDQGQQAEEEHESNAGANHCYCWSLLVARPEVVLPGVVLSIVVRSVVVRSVVVRSIRPSGRWSFARRCFSRLAI